jgi:hypothetical protein
MEKPRTLNDDRTDSTAGATVADDSGLSRNQADAGSARALSPDERREKESDPTDSGATVPDEEPGVVLAAPVLEDPCEDDEGWDCIPDGSDSVDETDTDLL